MIIGNDNHPEVEGIRGWCSIYSDGDRRQKQKQKHFCADPEQAVCVVSQTTFNYNKFQDLVEIISKKCYDILVLNTICNATRGETGGGEADCCHRWML